MERITVSLNKDVYEFVQNSGDDVRYRNTSHFVESCIRLVMEKGDGVD